MDTSKRIEFRLKKYGNATVLQYRTHRDDVPSINIFGIRIRWFNFWKTPTIFIGGYKDLSVYDESNWAYITTNDYYKKYFNGRFNTIQDFLDALEAHDKARFKEFLGERNSHAK